MARQFSRRTGWATANVALVRNRALAGTIFLALAFFGLLARLWFLQVFHGPDFLAQAQNNRLRDVPLTAPRGVILDRNGVVLATSRVTHSISLVPAALPSPKREPEERQRILKTLGFLLKITPAQIEAEIEAAREKGGRLYDPVAIVEEADLATVTLIEENKWRLGRAVLVTDDIKRFYPQRTLAAHILGYTRTVDVGDLRRNAEEIKADPDARDLKYYDVIGKNGLERQYDRRLAGTEGSDEYEVDSRARPVRRVRRIREKPGQTLVLTIDAKLQRAAEIALSKARNSGAVAAINPQTGEVLALASTPTFDPNVFSLPRRSFNAKWPSIQNNPKHPLINRATGSRFPPGSTFKPFTASAGLQQGTTSPGSMSVCNGGYHLNKHFFGCWSRHGAVDFFSAMAGSCDVFFYQAALRMGDPESSGPTHLAQVARKFGLGEKTGIDLPSDNAGLIPDPAWRREINKSRPDLARWFPGNTLNMCIGQGDVLLTPLQLAHGISAIANGGTLWRPHLLRQTRGPKGETTVPEVQKRVDIDPRNLALVREAMRRVMTDGTGQGANLSWLTIAGKTGSAEDVHHVLPHAWFTCFAPYDKPSLVIACIIENSGHGSENAAPVCKAILEAAFPPPAGLKTKANAVVPGD